MLWLALRLVNNILSFASVIVFGDACYSSRVAASQHLFIDSVMCDAHASSSQCADEVLVETKTRITDSLHEA